MNEFATPLSSPLHRVSFDFGGAFDDTDDPQYHLSQGAMLEELARSRPTFEAVLEDAENLSTAPANTVTPTDEGTPTRTETAQETGTDVHAKHGNALGDDLETGFSNISLSESPRPQLPEQPGRERQESIDMPGSSSSSSSLPSQTPTSPPSTPPDTSSTPSASQDEAVNTLQPVVIASSSTSADIASTPKQKHARTPSIGPSALEKVISKTRPSFLPPKPKQEDVKHMSDWEVMMKQSRVAAEKRRKAFQERRALREKQVEDSLAIWEREIVPNWSVVHTNPRLRKLWWKGIPSKLRASMWEKAVGNPLALNKDNYRTCLARAKRAISRQTFPTTVLSLIEEDMERTLPALHIFNRENGPLYEDLREMLIAWVVARSDEGLGYVPGVARIAAMFLIVMPAQQGFVVMRNLFERHCLRTFYGGLSSKDDVEAYYRIFDTLLADGMPKIYFNFKQHQISPAAYLPDWLIPLFLDHLPFEACARLWDVIILEGDAFLYRAALSIFGVLESRLFFPDREELIQLLKGENKAAIEVAKREGLSLDGGKYEIYGVDEETLWERIDALEGWWKPSTWVRLTQRELS